MVCDDEAGVVELVDVKEMRAQVIGYIEGFYNTR